MNFFFLFTTITFVSLCDSTIINVQTANELKNAFLKVKPGDIIQLADGTYTDSKFIANVSGTKSSPIRLKGSKKAVLTTGDSLRGFGLYLKNVNYWILEGFSVMTAQKV